MLFRFLYYLHYYILRQNYYSKLRSNKSLTKITNKYEMNMRMFEYLMNKFIQLLYNLIVKSKQINLQPMNQSAYISNQGIKPQETNTNVNTKTQFYAEELNQSNVKSIVSHTSNPQSLLRFFQNYTPMNSNFDMAYLLASVNLKLKKYKESVYFGEFVNGKRHGKGLMIYQNGRTYEGDWECDYKHGQGYQKFNNQCVYLGDYVNGRPQGVGRYSWPNGQFYQGQWINGLKQGSGMWKGAKGDSYVGQWKFGRADGYGVHTWINGDRYEGEFKECLKHGEGIQKFANGDIYKGFYANGKPSGFGEYYWANGSYFKGTFKNGLRDGNGMWKKGPGNNDKYEGEYINDKKCGYGIFTWAAGNVYKGNYEADVRNGYGEMYWNDGSFYKGNWNNGIQHGQGQIFVPGQGYKKGIFQNNNLIIVQKESNLADEQNNFQPVAQANQSIADDPEKLTVKSSYKSKQKNNVMPSKVSFRSRGYSSINRARQYQNSEENAIIANGGRTSLIHQQGKKKNVQENPPLPKRSFKREQKYITIQRRSLKPRGGSKEKERILHSSFYMHKLHNRANTSINGSKADADSGFQISQDYKNTIDELRNFSRSRARNIKTPHV